jgi:hypothetical protein
MKRYITVLSLCLIATAAFAENIIFSPDTGLLCDKKIGFCADSEGISVAYTKQYLGDKAEKKLMDKIHAAGGVDKFDTTTFTFYNNAYCDTKAKKCKVSKNDNKPDPVGNTLFQK